MYLVFRSRWTRVSSSLLRFRPDERELRAAMRPKRLPCPAPIARLSAVVAVADKRFAKCGETFWRVVERYQDRVPVSRLERDDAGAALQPGVDTCGCVTGVSAARGREARGERAGVGRLHGDAVQAKHWLHDTRSCVTDPYRRRRLRAAERAGVVGQGVDAVGRDARRRARPLSPLSGG
jgi:hypothetical protein